ncbi:xylulokinase [Herbiconiux sp. CPCC 203407]|uniref:Xylulose kinase n=1 Tax=Herbiconiux oxytropis TaxID=2970915 RepID=A0AA41XHH9_9MICO|nr:xylulokinase [Herbiconiux oxytropis]MCS5720622.1 xylulokinase [Herbiconiux oxytropis]MCS5725051.1 xylulokinase [Herbiconiux oxytropis]
MRDVYLGVDLGTSSAKAVLLDGQGLVLAQAQSRYDVHRPASDWAEQDPESWWRAVCGVISDVLSRGPFRVLSVGLAGQMHGLVLVDDAGLPTRNAIIWSDSRSRAQERIWADRVGNDTVTTTTGFPIATGFAGVSLSWVRDEEPEAYGRASTVLLPKDFIRYRLTGELSTEPTDAGGSLLYDIRHHTPATAIMSELELDPDLFPSVVPSLSVSGAVSSEAARETGLAAGTPVAAGGSDQSMGTMVLGLEDPSRVAIAISSGGTVFKRTARPLDSRFGLHVMPHAVEGTWLAMGVVLSAGLGIDWLADRVFGEQRSPAALSALMADADDVPAGSEGLMFSAALAGTRTPRVDASRRGSLVGLGFEHGKAHIARAMVEGVCVGLDASVRSMAQAGEPIREIVVSGGGARFPVWRQTLSDVTGLPVVVSSDLEHSAMGAASTGALAVGRPLETDFGTHVGETIHPDPAAVAVYSELRSELASVELALANRKEPQS